LRAGADVRRFPVLPFLPPLDNVDKCQMLLQKVHVENFFRKNRQKLRCQFFLDFIWFYRIFGWFLAMEVQKHYKKPFAKKMCRKVFRKKSEKIQNRPTDFFSICFYHVFGRFSVKGS
jgi:hypothetical protein